MSLKGLVQQHQVDIAAVKARERALQRGFGGFIAVVFHPDFAGDEDFFTRYAALFDALPHFAFIGISLGGVNVAIACFDGLRHSLRGFCGRNLEDAEAEDGDFDAVVQGEGLHGVFLCDCRLGMITGGRRAINRAASLGTMHEFHQFGRGRFCPALPQQAVQK